MEKAGPSKEVEVKRGDPVLVPPSPPSPTPLLHLSPVDAVSAHGAFNCLLVYNASPAMISSDPAKIIRQALSKVLAYYFPFAGRLRSKENGGLELECTGEGALFVEATADYNLSVLEDLDEHNPSFQQLLFLQTLDTPVEDFHLLTLQVTRFTCGGFVVGATFHHGVCDGRGAGQFLKGLAEIVRGDIKPSVEPVWNRELLKPEDLAHLQFFHFEMMQEDICNPLPPPIVEEPIVPYICIDSKIINRLKQLIVEECEQNFSAFDVVAALAWRARIKALQIPHDENVKVIFAMDMRRSLNPPLPKGYYGNAVGLACALDNVHNLLNTPLSHTAMIIKKSKESLNDENFRSRAVMNQTTSYVKPENVLILSDWRQLGFHEVDFGWGDAMNVRCVKPTEDVTANCFVLMRPPKNKPDGIKLLLCTPPSIIKSCKIEMEAMIRTYMQTATT